MGNDYDDPYPHEEEEGGPSKSFLEHLEDLRWTLMKCAGATAVTFLLCLLAAPTLVRILTWPLDHMDDNPVGNLIFKVLHIASGTKSAEKPSVQFFIGTNRIGSFKLETNQAGLFGTNVHSALELSPITVGTNVFLGLKPLTNAYGTDYRVKKVNLVNLGPAAAFFLAVQIALYGGIALASPFLFYFIGGFVFPALKVKEKKYTFSGLAIGLLLFLTGICFCYFILMPVALKASIQYSEWMGFNAETWRAEEYISFVCKFILGMGLGFELPVVLLVLVKIGILDYAKLAGFRRYMIVINLILGAMLTTPEVVTQILMAIPLQLLYEVTIWIAWYWERKERKERKRDDVISV
ncbi:MAG: twin-arginine translocase subunit TatC [Verrucomicrobiota bacterium]